MYKKRVTTALTGAVLLAGVAAPHWAHAQDPEADSLEVRVYVLKHLDCYEAHERINEIFGNSDVFGSQVTLSPVERTNSLIARAPARCLEEIESLLKKIDVTSAPEEPGGQEWIYRLRHREAERVAEVVQTVLSRRMRMAFDDETNIIILQGPDQDMQRAKGLLKELDVPTDISAESDAAAMQLTVHFIRAGFSGDEACKLPGTLAGVAGALSEQGVRDCRLLGQIMARTQVGEHFRTTGVLKYSSAGEGITSPVVVGVHGIASMNPGGSANLEFNAKMDVPTLRLAGTDNAGNPITTVDYVDAGLETTSSVPLGEYLVLGAIPTTIEESNTVILVIRIN